MVPYHLVKSSTVSCDARPAAVVYGVSRRVWVANGSDLLDGEPRKVEAFGRDILLVRHQGKIYALDNVCPHRGAPMHRGEVRNGCIECPLHGWVFSLMTGQEIESRGTLQRFTAGEDDDDVFLVESGG